MNSIKLQKKILRKTGKAIFDYNLISDGDKILVGLSGGKDSWTLLQILSILQAKAPIKFTIKALKVSYPHTKEQNNLIASYCKNIGIDFYCVDNGMRETIESKSGQNISYCALCSRFRRGILYSEALKYGFNKIALGHHRDDFNSTLLMNLFFQGQIWSMKPIMKADQYDLEVIRPFVLVDEKMIANYSSLQNFPIVPSGCEYSDETERDKISNLIDDLEKKYPQIKNNIISAVHKEFTKVKD
jgi:tRNA 2-thiocytidine biosynthesis protein TtcA